MKPVMKRGPRIRLRILMGMSLLFILSLFAPIVDYHIGSIIMGIVMFTYFIVVLSIFAYDVISPANIVRGINKQIDEAGTLKPKGIFLSFTLAMMAIGLFFVFASAFVWFKYYI